MLRRPVAVYRIIDEEELLGASADYDEPYEHRDTGGTGSTVQPGSVADQPSLLASVSGNRRRLAVSVLCIGGVLVAAAALTVGSTPSAERGPVISPRRALAQPRRRVPQARFVPLPRAHRPVRRRRSLRPVARTTHERRVRTPSTVMTSGDPHPRMANPPASPSQEFGFER
jgi:hypothetical protein